MLRALVVITIGLLLSGCALDATNRPPINIGTQPAPRAKVKIVKQVAVVPAPVADPAPTVSKRTVTQGKPKAKKEKHWYTPWR
jgi:hypothetical protein